MFFLDPTPLFLELDPFQQFKKYLPFAVTERTKHAPLMLLDASAAVLKRRCARRGDIPFESAAITGRRLALDQVAVDVMPSRVRRRRSAI
ncbi:MAG: hypothetical protein BGN95_10150 [Sphingomonas sp. 66-10]|uniref:hypothetical protein n=1 Tax=Sphingomonas sp. 66-10 TaxID=1895848 RepID=UPI000926EA5D|nr:hypothetical protein [Sphingomonas sp. 66-10]OJU17116.1 MAG: hypothetical protein BGN95_10150 [Sphingomonas sp. 66-10]